MQTKTPATWLDAIPAIPYIGLALKPSFQTTMLLTGSVGALADLLIPSKKIRVTNIAPGAFVIEVLKEGISIRVTPNNIVAEFQYNNIPRDPVNLSVEMRPYSSTIDVLLGYLGNVSSAFRETKTKIEIYRFGLVAQAMCPLEMIPPGVMALKEKLQGSWNKPIIKIDSLVTAELASGKDKRDLCHYKIQHDDHADPPFLGFHFDWQRIWETPVLFDSSAIHRLFGSCVEDALNHFEAIAEGSYDDEH